MPLYELFVVCAITTGAGLAIGLVWQEVWKKNKANKWRAYTLIVIVTFLVHGYLATAIVFVEKVGLAGGPVQTAAGLALALLCGAIGFVTAKK